MNKNTILRIARTSGIHEAYAKAHIDSLVRFANTVLVANRRDEQEPIGWVSASALFSLTKSKDDKKFYNIYPFNDGYSKTPVYLAKPIKE